MYELSNVTKNYLKGSRTVSAVCDLNLVISDGEWLAIQGRTGHGKSTLLHILGALDRPTAGTVTLAGQDLTQAVMESTLPAPAWKAGKGARPAEHCRRDIVDANRYLVKEEIQWRAMPCDLPPFQTVYDVLDR